ncbi:hypothetical protein EC991_003025 [Linnemannia zychae]|nr:hypothetical protein EC991_003025 [Linnemannia zychae]
MPIHNNIVRIKKRDKFRKFLGISKSKSKLKDVKLMTISQSGVSPVIQGTKLHFLLQSSPPIKVQDSVHLAEIVAMSVLQKAHYRRLLSSLTKDFGDTHNPDVNSLQALWSLPSLSLQIVDLIRTLSVLRVLDVMAGHKV